MKEYYNITEKLRSQLQGQTGINSVTLGDINSVDLNVQTIFPLAHVIVNSSAISRNVMSFNISVIFADLVDVSMKETKDQPDDDVYWGQDNLQDVYNKTLAEANILSQQMLRGGLFDDYFQVSETITAEPFEDRFKNLLAGWTITFDVETPNVETCVS
jgi:hypothetical protein